MCFPNCCLSCGQLKGQLSQPSEHDHPRKVWIFNPSTGHPLEQQYKDWKLVAMCRQGSKRGLRDRGMQERAVSYLPVSVHSSEPAREQSFFVRALCVLLWRIIDKQQLCSHYSPLITRRGSLGEVRNGRQCITCSLGWR